MATTDVWSAYSEKVMEHFRNPRNVGDMEDPDGIGHVGNVVCGDIMELYIRVEDGVISSRPSVAALPSPPARW